MIQHLGVQSNSGKPLLLAFVHSKVAGNSATLLIGQLPGTFIANPAVDTSPARVHPKDVFEAKIFAQAPVQYLQHHSPGAFLLRLRAAKGKLHTMPYLDRYVH